MTSNLGAWQSEERVKLLAKLWSDGLTCSQIAKQLNTKTPGPHVSRNAVIGKRVRMGLPDRAPAVAGPKRGSMLKPPPTSPFKNATSGYKPSAKLAPVPAAPAKPRAAAAPEAPGMATAQTLGRHMCKWPIGDPASDDFTFCGRRTTGGPYCVDHAQVARAPADAKRPADAKALARSLRRYL